MALRDSGNFKWPQTFSASCWTGLGVETYSSWLPILGEKTGMKVRLTPTFDTVCRFRWLRFGLVDMTAGGTTVTSQMLEADRRYSKRDSGPFQFRAFWAQSKTNSGYMVRGDSYIKTTDDIRPGIRVVDMRSYMANQRILEAFLVWGGLMLVREVISPLICPGQLSPEPHSAYKTILYSCTYTSRLNAVR